MVSKQSIRPVRRTQVPAIAWAPARDSYYILAGLLRSGAGALALHVTQPSLLELEGLLSDATRTLPFGLLAGGLYTCSQTKLVYLLVDSVIPSRTDVAPDDPRAQLAASLRALAAEATRRKKLVIGWYLGRMEPEAQLDPEVDSLHQELFPEQWQVLLVDDASAGSGTGAFMRFESIGKKYYAIPFWEELFQRAAREKAEVRRTAIHWTNYNTTEPVSPLDAPTAVAIAAANGSSAPPGRRLRDWLAPLRRAVNGAPAMHVSARRVVDEAAQTSLSIPPQIPGALAQGRDLSSRRATQEPLQPAVENGAPPQSDSSAVKPTGEAHADLEVPPPTRHQVFINGEMITFSEWAPGDREDLQLASQWNRRIIMVPAFAAIALLVAIGIFVLSR